MARYFLCGVGGSGMMPLALALKAHGHTLAGSDRSFDQGRTPQKKSYLESLGVRLHPQDGSGVKKGFDAVIVSGAVEETVPDVVAARANGVPVRTRAEMLASLFNAAPVRIAVGGTSGKSTTTGMIGWILTQAGMDPTIVNGAVMRNFYTPEHPYASIRAGSKKVIVAEVDESDGSIDLFNPGIAVVTNIRHDHMAIPALQAHFRSFIGRAGRAVLNATDPFSKPLLTPAGAVARRDPRIPHRLLVPGAHNRMNAAMAAEAARLAGVDERIIQAALATFTGIKRRYETVGNARGIRVIDDFGHNPDKIAATLATARAETRGRLLVFFQFHGYGPLALMHDEFLSVFKIHLQAGDTLYVPDVMYAGGTVKATATAETWVDDARARGIPALHVASRAEAQAHIRAQAREGDTVLVMGARDDTLSDFAYSVAGALR